MNTRDGKKDRAWYVVHTRPRQELRALAHLENQAFECFLPMLGVERLVRGKLRVCDEPLFPRYIFVRLDLATARVSSIMGTRGVAALIAFGGKYAAVPDELIEALASAPRIAARQFARGDRVEIQDGPFKGIEGVFQIEDGEARALVLIELMSRPATLSVGVSLLKKSESHEPLDKPPAAARAARAHPAQAGGAATDSRH